MSQHDQLTYHFDNPTRTIIAFLKPSADHDPLKRFKIQDEKDLTRELNIAQVFGNYSNNDIPKAIALRHPDICLTVGADDVQKILDHLKDHDECGTKDYARLKKVAAQDKYGNGISEGQDALKDWDVDIDMAKRRYDWSLRCLQVSRMDYSQVLFTYI